MSRIEVLRSLDEEINREISDIIRAEDSVNARRREFMESDAVKSHMERHSQQNVEASLVFPGFDRVAGGAKKKGIESIASESDEWAAFLKEQQKPSDGQGRGVSYESSQNKGVSYNAGGGEGGIAYGGFKRDSALCTASGCGCEFVADVKGNVTELGVIPGNEGKSYSSISKKSGEGYSASGSGRPSYSLGSASGKLNYR
ncbi:hypothetical protein HYY72_01050 [Candidatus Woesearchaeota archaeon]|nr:hypothetical protein [Candidatus Woesearchaeota archaeon]